MDVVHAETGHPVLIYDDSGHIIRATETNRIGDFHEGAGKIMAGGVDEYAVTPEEALSNPLLREGYSCAVYHQGKKIGAFGITGRVETVRPLAKIAVRMINSWIREREYEAELERSEKNFHLIFEQSPLGIVHYDSKGVITACNDRFVGIIGSSREQLVGLKMLDLPDHRVVAALKRALEGELSFFEGEYSSVTARKVTPVRLIFSPIFAAGEVLEGGIGIIEDVTERMRAEKGLKESEKRFRELAELLPEVIYEVDLTGRITFANERAFVLFGYTRREFESGLNMFDMIDEKDRQRAAANVRRIFEGEPVGLKEYRARRKDGTGFPALFHSSAIRQDNEVKGLRGFLIDITEKKRTQELLIQSEKMMSIGGLAAGMAHEINNPLAGIVQNAQVAISRMTRNRPMNEQTAAECGTTLAAIEQYMDKRGVLSQLRHIKSDGLRAAEIVRNMLSFAKKREPVKTPENLSDLVDKTVDLLKNDYSMKKGYDFKEVTVVRTVAPDLKPVSCEKSKIQQVIINILKNSVEAAVGVSRPSRDIVLTIRLSNDGDMVRMEIGDNGPGIDPDTCRHIFEPFFTTRNADGATGLGLSLSYFIIVDDHGGEMAVESIPGKGTTFIIRLPRN